MNSQSKRFLCRSLIAILGEDMRSILLKKGDRELLLEFSGIDDAETVLKILEKTKQAIDFETLLLEFPVQKQKIVEKIINNLVDLKIIIESSPLNIPQLVLDNDFQEAIDKYIWEKELQLSDFLACKEALTIRIIGFNNMGLSVINLIKKMGVLDLKLVDYPFLKNKKLKLEKDNAISIVSFGEFLNEQSKNKSLVILADEFGNIPSLIQLNKILFDKKLFFLTLFTMSQIGYFGPLVVPGKTSCFNCFLLRMEQAKGNINYLDASEAEYFDWQDRLTTHPSIISSVAHFFTFQLMIEIGDFIKELDFNSIGAIKNRLFLNYCNNITEIDLFIPKIFKRRIIRHPNCHCCLNLMTKTKLVFDLLKEFVK